MTDWQRGYRPGKVETLGPNPRMQVTAHRYAPLLMHTVTFSTTWELVRLKVMFATDIIPY